VWICFTKGLGAPIGAVLAGSHEFIEQARRLKHISGGALRQAGIAAAGCLYALDHHVERLAEDHANAKRLAAGLDQLPGLNVRNPVPDTNMVFFTLAAPRCRQEKFIAQLAEAGVRIGSVGAELRAVTHLDITGGDIDLALEAVARVLKQSTARRSARPRSAAATTT
jgi:threonine aldolase